MMAEIAIDQATEKLATLVESLNPTESHEVYAELFPEAAEVETKTAVELAQHVRNGLEPEELVDLWNVVIPADRNVWYDEEKNVINYNDEAVSYADLD